jgi:hypothetical protein
MKFSKLACGLALFLLANAPAYGQALFSTPNGVVVGSELQMCLNTAGQAVPTSSGQCAGGASGGGGSTAITGPLGTSTPAADALSTVVIQSALPTGAATATNQTVTHSAPGTSATTAETIQGSSTGVPVPTASAPTTSATAAIAPQVAGSAAASQVLKSSAGNLYSVYATCTDACWLMVFNATADPADGATTTGNASGDLVECVPISSGGIGAVNYSPGPPERFSVGVTAVISSTACATKTEAATGFIHGMVQ